MVVLPDRRKSARNPSLDDALIRFDGLSLCCTVRDITEDGAAVWADQDSELPDRFTLIIPPSKTWLCHVIWRKGGWIGVKFHTE